MPSRNSETQDRASFRSGSSTRFRCGGVRNENECVHSEISPTTQISTIYAHGRDEMPLHSTTFGLFILRLPVHFLDSPIRWKPIHHR